jgi:chloramphenicol-sensitive protein RarD
MTPATKRGLVCAFGAYVLWGGLSIYFKAVAAIPPMEVLSHRVVWSLLVTGIGVMITGDWPALRLLIVSKRRLVQLIATVAMLSINWLTYIWSVGAGHVIEAGLGYYICPLMSVLLAALILRERLSLGQLAGIACVGAGVLWQILAVGQVPWIALLLAITFSLYGLGRKVVALPAMAGLFAETLVMAPVAFTYLGWVEATGQGHFIDGDWHWRGLLMLAGPITAIPLLLFAAGANRLNLRTLGLMQYLNPTMQVSVAILLFGEAMLPGQGITFALIWLGLGLYSVLPLLGRRLRQIPERVTQD